MLYLKHNILENEFNLIHSHNGPTTSGNKNIHLKFVRIDSNHDIDTMLEIEFLT